MGKSLVLGLILSLSITGCYSVSKEARDQIKISAAVGTGTVKDWDLMTVSQKKTAHWKLVRTLHDLNFSINDVPLPLEFASVDSSIAVVSSK